MNVSKNKKVVRYQKQFHLNIGLIIFGIIFIYMMFYVFSYFTSSQTSVYEVIHGTIAINNSYTGLALRQEEIIYTEYSGQVNYYQKDTSKVGVGDLVYSVDTNGSIANQINSANEDASGLSEESIDKLQKTISEYSTGYRSEAFYETYTFKNDINAELSEALSMNALNSITDTVSAAEENDTFHKCSSPKDGVIVYYVDGFENITADTFTPEMFDKSTYNKTNLKSQTSVAAGDATYKLITDESWNLIIPITEETNRQLRDSSTVRVKFKKDNTILRAAFTSVEKEGTTYLILTMSHSMIRFAADRYIEVELLFDEETGLKIPNSAIASKDFYTVPMEYFQKNYETSRDGIIVQRIDKTGKITEDFITPNIYFATEYCYYVDGEEVSDGDILLKPNSRETYTIHETAKLEGIYSINKGYAIFKQIDIIYQNEEYAIIRSGTDYGVSLYDHIALDGSTITENALINE